MFNIIIKLFLALIFLVISGIPIITIGLVVLNKIKNPRLAARTKSFAISCFIIGTIQLILIISFIIFIMNSARYNFIQGLLYSRFGEDKKAALYYKKALKAISQLPKQDLRSYNFAVLYNMAKILHENGDYDEAFKAYSKALELARNNEETANAYYGIGYILMIKGRFDEAQQNYDKAIALNQNMFDAYQNRAVTFRLMGRYQDSIVACKQILKRFPESGKTYCSLGWAYEKSQRYVEAIKAQIQGIRLKWPYSKVRVDYCFSQLTNKKLAAKLLAELARVDPVLSQKISQKYAIFTNQN